MAQESSEFKIPAPSGLEIDRVRKSKRIQKMTEKGAELHSQVIENLMKSYEASYIDFKSTVRNIRNSLKGPCNEGSLGEMIDVLKDITSKASDTFANIRRKTTPSKETVRRQDIIEAVSTEIRSLLLARVVETEEDFDNEAEAAKLEGLLNRSYANSIFGSTVSRIKSTSSRNSQVSQNRIVIAAELAAKEAEIQMEAVIESQRSQLKKLEMEKDVKVLKAKLQAYDVASQQRQDLHSVSSEAHPASTQVSYSKSMTLCSSSSNSSTPSPNLAELVTPLRHTAPSFIPVSQQFDLLTSQSTVTDPVQEPPLQHSYPPALQTSNIPIQMHTVPVPTQPQHSYQPALQSSSGIPNQLYTVPATTHQPVQQGLSVSTPLSTVDSNTALARALQETMSLNSLPVPTPSIFSGDPLKFIEWEASFTALIDRKEIPTSQKFHHLKQYLSGEAKAVVEGTFFRTDDSAYAQAWEKLRKRYGQPYVVQRAFRQKISQWPKIGPKDYVGFRRFSDFLNSCYEAIPHVPGLSILNDCEENQKILHKLPDWITSRWNRIVTSVLEESGCYPNFEAFTKFLAKEADIACNPISSELALRSLETERPLREKKSNVRALSTSATKPSESTGSASPSSSSSTLRQATPSTATTTRKPAYCHFCKQEHSIHQCKDFVKEKIEDRKAFIIKNHLCFGCLKKGHSSKECRHRYTCATCQKRHPTLLHGDLPSASGSVSGERPVKSDQETPVENKVHSSISCHTIGEGGSTSMIVPVWVSTTDQPNQEILVYALLDTQSDTSFILEDTAAALSVQRTPVQLKLSTMTTTDCTVRCDSIKGLQVRGFSSHVLISISRAYTKDYIPVDRTHIPTSETAKAWQHLKGITSELQPLQNCEVGLLIGYDTPQALIPRETIVGDNSEPYGVKTDLGWSIVGCTSPRFDNLSRTIHRTSVRESPVISPREVLKVLEADFIDIDDEGLVSQEDVQFVRMMEKEIRHKDDGHYEMPLPFKSRPCLPNNRKLAEVRLAHLKKKLIANSEFKQHYVAFVEGMLKCGDAEVVRDPGVDGEKWYIPHHGVYHPKKPKKIRVVFDCSAKFQGTSLNDHLLTGPELTNELIGVLMRFRKHSIGIMCDVERMFHQFHVSLPDRNFLRFLWWEGGDISKEPQEFRMKVHLFGAASSPGCANYGFRTLAKEYESQYPLAAKFICRNFYVDDGVTSVSSADEAKKLVRDATELCKMGGLRLHKFVSNDRDVLENIPVSERVSTVKEVNLSISDLPVETALGIQWSLEEDTLTFSQSHLQHPATRRGILSAVASLFDPLGFMSPYVLKGKRILQEMCRRGVGWDDPLPEELKSEWEAWKKDQENLQQIRIPRCYHPPDFNVTRVELHHFSDASTKGYGQCSYLRLISTDGRIHCCFVTGKSRVAPTKVTTIPRLELTAAVTSVKVSCILKRELDYENIEEFFWTDSKVVLGYIHNEARRFHTFVSNRVQYIRDKTRLDQWGFVPTKQNPADYASRGLTVKELKESMWLSGPIFLWSNEDLEPEPINADLAVGDPEVRAAQVFTTNTCTSSVVSERLSRFSNWSLAVRAIARLKRFASGVKGEHLTTVAEQRNAVIFIIKEVQTSVFFREFQNISKKSSSLRELNPYVDNQGIIRVGGRLEGSTLPEEIKHPVIIPRNHSLTTLIIGYFHSKVRHQGRGMTINEIRSHGFWIIGMNKAVASYIYKCVTCRKSRRPVEEQKMANLPVDRMEEAPPFTFTGMDCFGPFLIKEKRKVLKCYGLLFTCMASRAVHIEMLDDMTTDAFINALRCFIALRGRVQVLRSDQGTNFLGARNEFEKGMKELDVARLKAFMADQQCEFVMNAPHSSHAGGVWERQIRTARSILSSLMHEAKGRLDTSSFRTFLYEVMYIMNSRPLTSDTSGDPLSLEPLTPNHVLTMKSNIAHAPPGQFVKEDVYLRKRWRRVQYLAEQFWSRWRKEYLQGLNKRQKWCTPKRNVKVGDIVLVHDKDSIRSEWPLAKVIEVSEGSDGLIRRVKVKTGTSRLDNHGKRTSSLSVLERPIQELVLLVESDDCST